MRRWLPERGGARAASARWPATNRQRGFQSEDAVDASSNAARGSNQSVLPACAGRCFQRQRQVPRVMETAARLQSCALNSPRPGWRRASRQRPSGFSPVRRAELRTAARSQRSPVCASCASASPARGSSPFAERKGQLKTPPDHFVCARAGELFARARMRVPRATGAEFGQRWILAQKWFMQSDCELAHSRIGIFQPRDEVFRRGRFKAAAGLSTGI